MSRNKGSLQDHLGLKGQVEILVYHGRKLVDFQEAHNLIFYQGHSEIIRTLGSNNPTKSRVIARMAIGDQGTDPADATVPKTTTPDLPSVTGTSGLYHEIYRKDIESRIFTYSSTANTNQCRFVTTFAASDVPLSSFSNPSQPRVNEVGLVLIDPVAVSGPIRADVAAPATPPSDEVVMSIRTFKSVPFEASNDVTVTIRYTIYMG